MADVTISSARSGRVEIAVQLYDGDEKPLAVDALSISLSNPDKRLAPSRRRPSAAEPTGGALS